MNKVTTRTKALLSSIIYYNKKSKQILGYSIDEFKSHIENLFEPGMCWENHGKWHIDHIIPISRFKYKSINDKAFKKCWALKNLRPLWAVENMKKGARILKHPIKKIMNLWKTRKNATEISHIVHLAPVTVRCIIKEQIGEKKYKERASENLRKGQQARRAR